MPTETAISKALTRLSSDALDKIGERLAEIEEETDRLRSQLKEQIAEFGFSPPKSEKSQRLESKHFRFTLSSASTTEIRDTEVERIRESCPEPLFLRLFVAITKYKLARGAAQLLASPLPAKAPRNLRQMFQRAVIVSESTPRLRVDKINLKEWRPGANLG